MFRLSRRTVAAPEGIRDPHSIQSSIEQWPPLLDPSKQLASAAQHALDESSIGACVQKLIDARCVPLLDPTGGRGQLLEHLRHQSEESSLGACVQRHLKMRDAQACPLTAEDVERQQAELLGRIRAIPASRGREQDHRNAENQHHEAKMKGIQRSGLANVLKLAEKGNRLPLDGVAALAVTGLTGVRGDQDKWLEALETLVEAGLLACESGTVSPQAVRAVLPRLAADGLEPAGALVAWLNAETRADAVAEISEGTREPARSEKFTEQAWEKDYFKAVNPLFAISAGAATLEESGPVLDDLGKVTLTQLLDGKRVQFSIPMMYKAIEEYSRDYLPPTRDKEVVKHATKRAYPTYEFATTRVPDGVKMIKVMCACLEVGLPLVMNGTAEKILREATQ